MRRKRTRRNRYADALPEVSLTPLIDTALTLLIIFMLTAPMMHNSLKVRLPHGSIKEAGNDAERIVVEVDANGQISVNGQRVARNQLPDALRDWVKKLGVSVVFVHGDRSVDYGAVIEVVDRIKHVEGVDHVALATAVA